MKRLAEFGLGWDWLHRVHETTGAGALHLATHDQTVPTERRAILVLGMHRSGTSALGGALNGLGVAAPKTLLAPRPDNPRGFFESAALADAHDALLECAGSCWDDWRRFDSTIGAKAAEQHRQKLKAVVIDEFEDAGLILIKDPRICRFVPLTLRVLAELNISPVAILPVRNPLEVAYSLKRRNHFSISKSLLLWLRHTLDAEYNSRGLPRDFLPYGRFLNDWRFYINRAAETLNIIWPARPDSATEKIENFLTAKLYHQKANLQDLQKHPSATSLVRRTYQILTAITVDGEKAEFLDQLDQIRTRFDDDCEMFGKVLESEFAVRRLRSKLEARDAHALQLQRNSSDTPSEGQNTPLLPFAIRPDSASIHFRPTAQVAGRSIECDNLAMARNSLIDAREAMAASAVLRLEAERDRLAVDLSRQIAERDKARSQQAELAAAVERATMERDDLAKLIAVRESELADAKAECSRLTDLGAARELEAERERNLLTASLSRAVAERDSLAAACSDLEIARSVMLSSRSWRWTAPLRFVRGLFG
jgi:hypothetical protein